MTTPLAATIAHPTTADALASYLDGRSVPYPQIAAYMTLMHGTRAADTQTALWNLACEGRADRVACGVWRGRGGST